ncbi:ethylene-responsive transcription factor ERF027-like protein, partial [Tanacetum coccineum]
RLGVAVEEKNSLLKARDEEVASLKAQLPVKEAEAICLRAEVQTLADCNTVLESEKSELDVKVADLTATVRVREQEVADLDVVVTSVKVHNDNLSDQVHTLEVSSVGL